MGSAPSRGDWQRRGLPLPTAYSRITRTVSLHRSLGSWLGIGPTEQEKKQLVAYKVGSADWVANHLLPNKLRMNPTRSRSTSAPEQGGRSGRVGRPFRGGGLL
jgi:hypothetical protein